MGRLEDGAVKNRRCLLATLLWVVLPGSVNVTEPAEAREVETTFYAAPEAAGDGLGLTANSAARFNDGDFWSRVQQALQEGPTLVRFVDGTYLVRYDAAEKVNTRLALSGVGHAEHQLTLQGITPRGAILRRHPGDNKKDEPKNRASLFTMADCQNVVVRHLHFTGSEPLGYAHQMSNCKDVLIDGCTWIDMPGIYYGATGTSGARTEHVVLRNCVFKRIGSGGHAHMIYNAYDPKHVRLVDCQFEDCAGDYVRFRDGADYCVVTGCTFTSTGTYQGVNRPFISVPLFNDDNPADRKRSPNYEYFGTHFLFFGNRFLYPPGFDDGQRYAILFHHSGYDPPGRNHLLTAEEGAVLEGGVAEKKKALLASHCGIDTKTVHVFDNTYTNVALQAAYRSHAAYGAAGKGWSGVAPIFETLNHEPVVRTAEEALEFFR